MVFLPPDIRLMFCGFSRMVAVPQSIPMNIKDSLHHLCLNSASMSASKALRQNAQIICRIRRTWSKFLWKSNKIWSLPIHIRKHTALQFLHSSRISARCSVKITVSRWPVQAREFWWLQILHAAGGLWFYFPAFWKPCSGRNPGTAKGSAACIADELLQIIQNLSLSLKVSNCEDLFFAILISGSWFTGGILICIELFFSQSRPNVGKSFL